MGKVLQQNYQNYAKTYLVQTRSQSKAKNARPSDTCTPLCAKAVGKVRKEIKPIIIDDNDEPIIVDLIRKVLFETELKFCSKVTSFRSQTWLLLLVCLGKCFPFEKPKDCCTIQFYYFPTYWYIFVLRCYRTY